MFRWLGDFVARFWPIPLILWAIALAAGRLAPAWGTIAQAGEVSSLPANSPSVQADRLFRQAFPLEFSRSSIVLVFYRETGELREQDEKFVDREVGKGLV